MYKELLAYLKSELTIRKWKHHIVRIESNLTNQGIPDIFCTVEGKSFWIECKIDKLALMPLQISFKEQEELAGGTVFGLVRTKGLRMEGIDKWILFHKEYKTHGSLPGIIDHMFKSLKGED